MKHKLVKNLFLSLLTTIAFFGMMGAKCTKTTSTGECGRIETIISEELIPQGCLSRDSTVLYLPAKNKNNAFLQAQNVCIKFGAGNTEKDGDSVTYELPDKSGKFTIVELKEDESEYVVLYLKVYCDDLKIREIRYISLKGYANL